MRDIGACMSPMTAFLLLQGVETLSMRMDRHLSNTRALLEYLSGHEQVAWVNHPNLPGHPGHALDLYLGEPLDPDGHVWELKVDATSGDVLERERED